MSGIVDKLAKLDPESRSLLAERLRQVKDQHAARPAPIEPIAVVGIGCRFPGGAGTPERFWQLLMQRRSGVSRVPSERFPVDDYHDPDPETPGAIISDRGAFIEDVACFDAAFFGVSPREARRLDPQHRLLLEVACEALEHAGLSQRSIAELVGGVFIGLMGNDYFATVQENPKDIDAYTSTGTHYSFAANRLSFHLDLKGPSMAIDSACSSSLVAVHQACQSLRTLECDFAIAGGVNLILSPVLSISYSKWGMLSPDGVCKTFDASANGFVRGEGAGVVVLKRLRDAIASGDPILAVVRGSAVNQDGATSVITAPSGLAQQAVIRRALKAAGVEPAAVGYVETHGTGTPLGDPIEVEALHEVYGRAASEQPCTLGAVKTNIGHLEGAAGIAGFIKAVLAIHHGQIPPNLNFQRLNPLIRLDDSRLRLAHDAVAWAAAPAERFAAVSSFGAGGTNAHVVLQGPPTTAATTATATATTATAAAAPGAAVVCLSAKSERSLHQQAERVQAWLRGAGAGCSIADLSYTTLRRRNHFDHRLAFAASSVEELREGLDAFLAGRPGPRWSVGAGARTSERPVFVFAGQGSQWAGMGRELLATGSRFAAEIAAIDRHFVRLAGWSIADALAADPAASRLGATEVAQPCLFALQLALVAHLDELGIRPAAVVGHSVGEIAAACVAGLLDREAATALVLHRARLMQQLTGRGRMAALGLARADAEARIQGDPRLALAAANGPRSVVVAGEAAPLEALVEALRADGVFARFLPVDYAFHSPQVDAITGPLREALEALFGRGARMAAPRLPMVSTVTGGALDASVEHAAYWVQNARATVSFERAIGQLLEERHDVFLEIGPHPTLGFDLREAFGAREVDAQAVATLRRDQPQDLCLQAVPAALYAAGMPAAAIPGPDRGAVVALPSYAWEHRRFWIRSAPRTEASWIYDLGWDEVPPPQQLARPRASWLVVGAAEGPSTAIADQLRAAGERVRHVSVASPCATPATSPGSDYAERIERWLDQDAHAAELDYLVYVPVCSEPSAERPDLQVDASCATLLGFVQALEKRTSQRALKIWIVTAGAKAVAPGEAINPFAAPLWGLGRVLALEASQSLGGFVDLPRAWTEADVGLVVEAMRHPGEEDQLAIREGRRHAPRLRRRPPRAADPAPSWQVGGDGVVLVTGGTRGLGLRTAQRLARRGARHLALVGRQSLPPRAEWAGLPADHAHAAAVHAIGELEAMGVVVDTYAADVADEAAMRRVFEDLARRERPVTGIVHAAGVSREAPLADVDGALIAETLAPKVAGTWWLHRLSRDCPLEFFVVFSSAAAVWGSAGLAPYAAANEFLNAVAVHRRGLGLPALSVCWGMWGGDGMATEHMRQTWTRLGLRAMDPERALNVLEELVVTDAVMTTVADVRWDRFRPVYELKRRRPLLASLDEGVPAPAAAAEPPEAQPAAPAAVTAELRALPRAEQRERVLALLRDAAAQILGLESGTAVPPDQGLFAMGFDSITAVELAAHLSRVFDRPYAATVVLDYPNLKQLRDFILRDCFGGQPEGPAPGDSPAPDDLEALLAFVESVDEGEAARLLELGSSGST